MSEADAELVRRALDGDRSAFESLVSVHALRARAVARGVLGDDSAVDDVVQESFIRTYNHLGQLGDPVTFPSWLCTIVRNEAISWLRRHGHEHTTNEEQLKGMAQQEPEREHPMLDRLRISLARISPQYREVLALKYEAGLEYDKIAEVLGISVPNVEKRLYRARQALFALMPELGGSKE
jgi:RNA polymerase sigma-70 factor, ECF subfamily